jgi:hypothetical protein
VTHGVINSGNEDLHVLGILTPPVREFVRMIEDVGRPRTPGGRRGIRDGGYQRCGRLSGPVLAGRARSGPIAAADTAPVNA